MSFDIKHIIQQRHRDWPVKVACDCLHHNDAHSAMPYSVSREAGRHQRADELETAEDLDGGTGVVSGVFAAAPRRPWSP